MDVNEAWELMEMPKDSSIEDVIKASRVSVAPGAARRSTVKAGRSTEKPMRVAEARTLLETIQTKMEKSGFKNRFADDMSEMVRYEMDKFIAGFRGSVQFANWCQARPLGDAGSAMNFGRIASAANPSV